MDGRRLGVGNLADAAEGVDEHLRLQGPLPIVTDVRQHLAAAGQARRHRYTVGRSGNHPRRLGPHELLLDPLHARLDALAGNGAGEEHHPVIVAGNHPAADRRPFHVSVIVVPGFI